jgi:hypothetical protein
MTTLVSAQFDLIIFIAFHICVVQSLYALARARCQ